MRRSATIAPTSMRQPQMLNHEGVPCFLRSDEERLLNVLMMGTFEPTFYASSETLISEASELFMAFLQKDPVFLAKALVYARNSGFIRLAPITGLVYLSLVKDKDLFYRAFTGVIKTPNDLKDFVQLVRGGQVRGMGRAVKTAVNAFLEGMSEYWAIKYGSDNQVPSLKDLYRMTRPQLVGFPNAIARYIVKGEVDLEYLTQIHAFERFKVAKNEDEAVDLIVNGRLPYEVVTASAPQTTKVWTALLHNAPYMNMLMNLNNFQKRGVFDNKAEVDFVCNALVEGVQKSRILPFRFYSAFKASRDLNPRVMSALNSALDKSFENLPEIPGKIFIANDVSGSMNTAISYRSQMTMMEIAALFAAVLFKKGGDQTKVISFDTNAIERRLLREAPILTNVGIISGEGGGTDLGAPMRYLEASKKSYDVGIFITDSESWAGYTRGYGCDLDIIRRYKATINPNFKAFFIQLVATQSAVVPPSEKDMYYIYGWSEAVIRFIWSILEGNGNQVDKVRQVVI